MLDGRTTTPRLPSRGERVADLWINGVALAAGVVGVIVLMTVAVPRGSLKLTVSLLVYGVGLLTMLLCSALYNGATASRRRVLLRRFDHAAIFVMIAGTYTPFLAVTMNAGWSRWLLLYVWAVAGVGVILKLVCLDHFARLSVVLYLFLGWTIVAAIDPLSTALSLSAVILLVIGGLLYTVGVLFHLWERLPYQQPIWHGFVVAAAACHYAAIIGEIALAGGSP